jgi:hypothetical protein
MPRSLSLAGQTASSLSVLGRPGRCSGVAGVDQPHHQAAGLQQVHERPPGVGGGLDHHPLDPLAGQLLGRLDDGVGGGRHLPHLGGALARLGRVRHPRAHHPDALATSIAATRARSSSDASTAAMSPSWATSLPPAIVGMGSGLPGSPVGTGTLIGVLKATVRDPAVGPRRQTESRPPTTKDASASAGSPAHFHPCAASRRDTSTETRIPVMRRGARGGPGRRGLELSDGSLASTVGVVADEVVATQIGVLTVVDEVASPPAQKITSADAVQSRSRAESRRLPAGACTPRRPRSPRSPRRRGRHEHPHPCGSTAGAAR